MSLFLPFKRATLLIPSGPDFDQERKHLFVLLTDPVDISGTDKEILLVSLSTVRKNRPYDPTCILMPEDHQFIKHESFVLYAKARIEKADTILRGVSSGKLIPRDMMSHSVVDRICVGLGQSKQAPRKILKFYEAAQVL